MRPQRNQSRKKTKLWDAERLYENVRKSLFRDLGDRINSHLSPLKRSARESDSKFLNLWGPIQCFKRHVQLRDFDKRIIWSTETSVEEIEKSSLIEFRDSQAVFGIPFDGSGSHLHGLVINEARSLVRDVLGSFDYDHFTTLCAFGRKAALGLPRKKAYLDERVKTLNGTAIQHAYFNDILCKDIHLLRAVRKTKKSREIVDSVKMTAVPKSFKAARIVAPDTVLGGFLSRGLGSYIRERLEERTHIDLALQPRRHRRWAEQSSKTGHLATLDMSKASDSFTAEHMELLLPVDWLPIVNACRIKSAVIGDKKQGLGMTIPLTSFMLMGSSMTFPLQTLLFWALCESVRRVMKIRGKVSVYGDDIITPIDCARSTIFFLDSYGFKINASKSFFDLRDPDRPSQVFFRESCGGDFLGGVNVRAYMPEHNFQEKGQRHVAKLEYLAMCYKLYNGLSENWSEYSIPSSLQYLLSEIVKAYGKVHIVKFSDPDYSGLRYEHSDIFPVDLEVQRPECNQSTYWCESYYRLVLRHKLRKRSDGERSYYWYDLWLKSKDHVVDQYAPADNILPEADRSLKGTLHFCLN